MRQNPLPTNRRQTTFSELPNHQLPGYRPQTGPWQAVIFDLDDTLYPERQYVLSGFKAVADWAEATLGIPAESGLSQLTHMFEQGVRGDTFNRWLIEHNLPINPHLADVIKVYRSHHPRLTPFPEVRPLLNLLSREYQLGLVSDGYLSVQQRKLTALKLKKYFNAVVFSDEFGREAWKPQPNPFQVVLERLQHVVPAQAIYIADNPLKDFLGAHRAGLDTIWVRWTGGEYTHLLPPTPAHTPDITLTSLTALHTFFTEYSL